MPLIPNKPRVIALGTFDGLHPGHRRVIERCVELARTLGARAMVYTFQENPRSLFDAAPLTLMPLEVKLTRMLELGADEVAADHFTKELCALSPEEFVNMLVARFDPVCFVCGEDYSFGSGGKGSAQALNEICKPLGIGVEVVKTVNILTKDGYSDKKVSSTEIRSALMSGDSSKAQRLINGEPI